ncbi:MAG: dynamin family protein [Lachnospiraceae bacterium]|nr:dynamin family protein [Lachnospiraceae bacterium]
MSNQDYTSYHGNVAEVNTALTQMGKLCGQLELEDSKKAIEASRHKLTSHKFSVGIMGEFKRGKSTVINALLGKEIMPADILPATATMNRVTYDLQPHAQVIKNDGTMIEISVDEIADYVTKLNDENAKRAEMVDEAVVYYPCQFCQNGVDIVDTPGLNDDERMDKISEEIIPKLDAVIMVIVPGAPFSKSEAEFVRNKLMGSDLGRLLFLVNKIDTIRPKERERAVADIKKRIQTTVLDKMSEIYGEDSTEYADANAKIGNIRIFPISAANALDARIDGDEELLEDSRIQEFEDALRYMLTTERGALELAAPLAVLSRTATEVINAAETRKNALQLNAEEFEKKQQQAMQKIAEFRNNKRQETARINAASQELKANLLPQVREFYDVLEKELNNVIEQTSIDKKSLLQKAGQHAASQKMQNVVNETIKAKMSNFSELMQKQLMDALGEQAARSAAFTTGIIEDLNTNIQMSFAPPSSQSGGDKGKNAVGLAGFAFDILTDFAGGPWGLTGLVKGYQEAGFKGAAVGLAAGVATTFGAAMILGSAGIVGLPLCIIASAASGATGKFAANLLFPPKGDKEYQALIENTRKQIKESVAQMRAEGELERTLIQRIENAFGSLVSTMSDELEKALHDTEQTLDLIKQDLTKNALHREQASKECDEVVASVDEIMTHLEPVMKAIQSGRMAG